MTDKIIKLYENAGIKPIAEYCKHQCNNEFDDDACIGCVHIEKVEYPPFTAKKQIELIKWLIRHRFNFMVYELAEKDFTFEVINKRLKPTSQFVSLSENNFEEGLAKVLNCFWQDLTAEEKQQVKGILEVE